MEHTSHYSGLEEVVQAGPVRHLLYPCANYRTVGRCNPGCIASVSISAVSGAGGHAADESQSGNRHSPLTRKSQGKAGIARGRRSPGTGVLVQMGWHALACVGVRWHVFLPLLFRHSDCRGCLSTAAVKSSDHVVIASHPGSVLGPLVIGQHPLRKRKQATASAWLSAYPLCRSRVFGLFGPRTRRYLGPAPVLLLPTATPPHPFLAPAIYAGHLGSANGRPVALNKSNPRKEHLQRPCT